MKLSSLIARFGRSRSEATAAAAAPAADAREGPADEPAPDARATEEALDVQPDEEARERRAVAEPGAEDEKIKGDTKNDNGGTMKRAVRATGALRAAFKYEVAASVQTDTGCVREINEDCGRFVRPSDERVLKERGVLLVVADGMGGHSAGEVASGMAGELVPRLYFDSGGEPYAALRGAVEEANRRIHTASLEDESKRGMGTTCTALVLLEGQAFAAHVGDSRLYMLRGGKVYLLTEDHSAVMEMVKLGLITMEQARHHEDKNVILRALGTSPEVEVTMLEPFSVRLGDQYLLCSDGLYDLVPDDEIERELSAAEDIHAAGERLITLAKARGGHDNITVGIAAVVAANGAGEKAVDLRATREWRVQG
jgi:PPM family protein phosphatase